MRGVVKRVLLVIGGALLVALVILGIIYAPPWFVASWEGQIDLKDLANLESNARTAMIQAMGGIVLLIGLFFTWHNLRITERNSQRTLDLSRKGQTNDRFTKAIEQIGTADQAGKKRLEVRLGGIYALEQIAKDSPDHYWPIMEVLTAYVRENAPWTEKEHDLQAKISPSETQLTQNNQPSSKPSTDIQAVLTVLGRRRDWTYKNREDLPLDLSETDLRGADLKDAHLEGGNLWGVHLEKANLRGAHLEGGNLRGAHLEKADAYGAYLNKAMLAEAYLEEACLASARLDRAHLWRAHLEMADLEGAYLERARFPEAYLGRANFTEAYLKEADFIGAHLQGAMFTSAHLEDANLSGAHLEQASFNDAHLQEANLAEAYLKKTNFARAHLEGVNLWKAHLQGASLVGAYLKGANLERADLSGANLEVAKNLTLQQLATVRTLFDARLDAPLLEQIQRQYPHLLEKPQDQEGRL
jgi:uncharacterized protein YjbI with pentapeptide repeats